MEAASEGSDDGEVLAVELQAIFATMQENVAAHAASKAEPDDKDADAAGKEAEAESLRWADTLLLSVIHALHSGRRVAALAGLHEAMQGDVWGLLSLSDKELQA